MKLRVEWPAYSHWVKKNFDTSDVCDELNIPSALAEIIKLSHTYDVIIDNGVVTFVEKS